MGIFGSFGDEAGYPVIDRSSCTLCGECAGICAAGILSRGEREIFIDRSAGFGCIGCGHCMMVCPMGSISVSGRNLSREQLVDLPAPGRRATFEQLEALFLSRRSIRRFRKEPVPREIVDKVISAAATAPMGVPPWEVGVTVFHGKDKVRELSWDIAGAYEKILEFFEGLPGRIFRKMMRKPQRRRFDSFILPLGRALVIGKKKGVDYVLYDAPVALLFHASPYGDGADAFIACTYAMAAAHALGLGTCMIGSVPPVLERRKDLMRKHGIPEGHIPKVLLILGWPAVAFRHAIRRPFLSVDYR